MRENGYYWVSMSGRWKIMQWSHGAWCEFNTCDIFDDCMFDEIDERRITRVE